MNMRGRPRCAVRVVLLRDVRIDLVVAVEALDLGGGRGRSFVGDVRHRAVGNRRAGDRQPARAEKLTSSFRGDAKHRTRNLEIRGLVPAHPPGLTVSIASLGSQSRAVTSAAARFEYTASAISSPADRLSWPRRRSP